MDKVESDDELSEDGHDLLERVVQSARPVVFLLGSAFSLPERDGLRGVPSVRGVVELLSEALKSGRRAAFHDTVDRARQSDSSQDFGQAYREGFALLLRRSGQDAANLVIRRAVLQAHRPVEDQRAKVLAMQFREHGEPCQGLLDDLSGWEPLRPSVRALGDVLGQNSKKFPRVLTTNFDPLVEVAVRSAGGETHRTVLSRDGNPANHSGSGTHVVYVHGYWFGADTLHADPQLQQRRPQLETTLKRWCEHVQLVVLGYGGWDDVLMRALAAAAADEGAMPEIAWVFFKAKEQRVVEHLGAAGSRAQFFEHVDLHRFLPRLRDRLRAPRPILIEPSHPPEPDDETVDGNRAMPGEHEAWQRIVEELKPPKLLEQVANLLGEEANAERLATQLLKEGSPAKLARRFCGALSQLRDRGNVTDSRPVAVSLKRMCDYALPVVIARHATVVAGDKGQLWRTSMLFYHTVALQLAAHERVAVRLEGHIKVTDTFPELGADERERISAALDDANDSDLFSMLRDGQFERGLRGLFEGWWERIRRRPEKFENLTFDEKVNLVNQVIRAAREKGLVVFTYDRRPSNDIVVNRRALAKVLHELRVVINDGSEGAPFIETEAWDPMTEFVEICVTTWGLDP